MRNKLLVIICATLTILLTYRSNNLYAQDFEGQEDYYEDYCSSPRNDANEAQICSSFREYMTTKSSEITNQIDGLNQEIATIQNSIESIGKQIDAYTNVIDELDSNIQNYEQSINKIQEGLIILEASIIETEEDIKERDDLIKSRMVKEQVGIGTNTYVEVLMGSKDIVELIRMVDGIQRITENDQTEIEKLNADKEKLNVQKQEQERLKQDVIDKQNKIKEQKSIQEKARKEQEVLLAKYKQSEAELIQEKRSQQSKADAIQSAIININTSVAGSVPEVPVNTGGWISPINASIGEGTFAYSMGGFHAGADFPTGKEVGVPVVAPINGVIVYSANPVGTWSGYPECWDGYPAGGGNSIHMIGQVDGTTYAMSFFHLMQENWITSPGQTVSQGQVIAYNGKSGNTTGPHLHFEIINLGSMSMEQAIAQFQSTLDFAWGTGWYSASTACINNGYSIPCRERPESFVR